MVWIILSLGVVAFLIAASVCAAVRRLSLKMGMVDAAGDEAHKRELDPGETPVPNTGGIGVFWAIALPVAAILLAVWIVPGDAWAGLPSGETLAAHLPGLRATSGIGVGILAALAVVHALGLIDDRRALGPWGKLGVQAAAAAGLVLFCDIRVLSFLADSEAGVGAAGWALVFGLSFLWIVVVTNAMNFLDNMDGLAGGVGLIAAGLYLAATLIGGQWFVAALASLLCGALLGFLLFNFPPAKLYLGDGGSLVVGLLLAVVSVRTTYVAPPESGLSEAVAGVPRSAVGAGWYGALMPVLVLAVPLYDFTSVTLIRLRNGKSPLRGDHNHFSHRLLRRGLSKRKVLAVIGLAALSTGLGGVMLGRLEGWQAALVAGQAAAVLAMIALLESG